MPVVRCYGSAEDVLSLCQRMRPSVLVVDQPALESMLHSCSASDTNPMLGTRVLVASVEDLEKDQERLEGLLRSGCWGLLRPEVAPRTVWKAAQAVAHGQFWISRTALTLLARRHMLAESLGLTAREAEILCLVAQGCRNHEIAQRLFISIETVRWHLRSLYNKLGVHDRLSAAMQAFGLFEAANDPRPAAALLEASGSR